MLGKAVYKKSKGSAGLVLARGGELPLPDPPAGTLPLHVSPWFPQSILD